MAGCSVLPELSFLKRRNSQEIYPQRRDGIWSDKIVSLFCFVKCIIASEQSSIILSAHVPACIDSAHIESMSILNQHIEFVWKNFHWWQPFLPDMQRISLPMIHHAHLLQHTDKSIFGSSGFVYVLISVQFVPITDSYAFWQPSNATYCKVHLYLFLSFWSFGFYEDRTSLCCHQIL